MGRLLAGSVRLHAPLDLASTLHGGQAFRWRREGGAWQGVLGARVVELRPTSDGLGIDTKGATRRALESYFRLEPADAARRARLAKDPYLGPTVAANPGLRLLRQEPWEATAAFLTSANNNVLRIEGILQRVAERWGTPLEGAHHAFPDAETLGRAREQDLRAVGLGYRAPFLRETARLVAKGDVALERGAPLEDAREELQKLPGVGPKVADCIALFALDCDDAFPIDRWILRAVAQVAGRELAPREAAAFARDRWGGDAGLAQQFLFHAVRLGASAPGTSRLVGAPQR